MLRAMTTCAACRADCSHTLDVCPLTSRLCADCLCEACVARLFRIDEGREPCPACGYIAKAGSFSDCRRERQQHIEPKEDLRRQICGIYCKKREDFTDAAEYNDYLEQREDLISRLWNPSSVEDVQDVWRHVEQYEEENREQIQSAHGSSRSWPLHGWKSCHKIHRTDGYGVEGARHLRQKTADSPMRSVDDMLQDRSCASAAGPQMEANTSGILAPDSPSSPQPFLEVNITRQMSGGGQTPSTRLKKARYYFFKDLAAGSRALQSSRSGGS